MKSKLLILFTLLTYLLIISCDKEEQELQLGDYIYDLKVDSVYQALNLTYGFGSCQYILKWIRI